MDCRYKKKFLAVKTSLNVLYSWMLRGLIKNDISTMIIYNITYLIIFGNTQYLNKIFQFYMKNYNNIILQNKLQEEN